MKLLRLRITKYGSFTKTQEFVFPDGPGLYFMWGRNEAEPRLEGNGSGKSTVWSALTWVLFGKTPKGLQAGNAANWDAGKGTVVELDYEMWGGVPLTIGRTWSPNSWYLRAPNGHVTDLAKDPSNAALDELKLELQPFLSCILMAQGMSSMFLDMKAEAKAALFAEVMKLDHWLERSERASNKAKEWDDIARSLEGQIADLVGQLKVMEATNFDEQAEAWERSRAARLDDLERAFVAALAMQDRAKGQAQRDAEALTQARAAYRVELERSDEAASRLSTLQADLQAAKVEQGRLEGQAHSWLERAKALHDHDHCPTCGQVVKEEVGQHFQKEVDQLSDDLERVKIRVTRMAAAHNQQVNVCTERARETKRRLTDLDDLTAVAKSVTRDVANLEADLDRIEGMSEQIEKEVNPWAKAAQDASSSITATEDALYDLRKGLEQAQEQRSLAQAWVRWFKEVRLSQIGEALEQLEIEVNSCVVALGLVGWSLEFEVDRETAKGSLQRGFNVVVTSPHNPKPVPWESWSGGESQRLRLAGNMGLSNLIRARTGTTLDLEVWDEPTQWMTAQGVQDLLEQLAHRAETERRQIWVIDHRTLGFAGFKGSAGVIKTRAGSHFDLDGLYISGKDPAHAHNSNDQTASETAQLHDIRRRARAC